MCDKNAFEKTLSSARHAVFFGGAGVSTASGIPDFRSDRGIFTQNYSFSPEEIVSGRFFHRYPEKFYAFYKSKMLFPSAKPNACHLKLAELEKKGVIKSVVTQNIDGLHQKAGSENVLELHGSALRNYCLSCGAFFPVDYILSSEGVPVCSLCGGTVKPDVVLYGENLHPAVLQKTAEEIEKADLLIVGGTSLAVYPAASFVDFFKGTLAVVNKSPTPADEKADFLFREDIASFFASLNV